MARRKPTLDEVSARVKTVATLFGLALYVIIGFGGAYLFAELVHDSVWRENFHMVWWLPSGAAALFCKAYVEDYMLGWVDEN